MPKYEIIVTLKFKKDYKQAIKRGKEWKLLEEVVDLLANGKTLPDKYWDHKLTGDFSNYRECHIQPDWLLIYTVNSEKLILNLMRTGSHSDLF